MRNAAVDHQAISFWSDGSRLKGDVFKPKDLNAGQRLPGILLIHGWGGNRANLNNLYAPQLASRGFVVLTFDLRSWGESDGFLLADDALPAVEETGEVSVKGQHVRSIVNPLKMIEDARAALSWFVAEPNLQADNIGVWGTSLGGGLALVTAANDRRVKALVTQVAAVNNKANFAATAPSYSTKRPEPEATAVQQLRSTSKVPAPAVASLSLSDANVGGGGAGIDSGGWSDEDDDFDVGGGGGAEDEEDFFSSFGAKPTSSTGLKIGGLKAASKPGGKGKLVMPSKSKNKPSIAAPKPAVKKLTKDDDVDGWDDF